MKTTFIYILWDPRSNNKCYIGKADNPFKRFTYGHLMDSHLKGHSIKKDWIKKLKRLGLKPILEIIDEISVNEHEFWERHYISLYKSWGFDLTNDPKCPGGESGPSAKGRKHSEEHKRKLSLLMIERMKDPQERLKRSIKQKGKIISQKQREQISQANKGKVVSNITKQKLREANLGKQLSNETKYRISIAMQKRVDWICSCGSCRSLTPSRAKRQKYCSYKCREVHRKLNLD